VKALLPRPSSSHASLLPRPPARPSRRRRAARTTSMSCGRPRRARSRDPVPTIVRGYGGLCALR
jgi:hypothetical protein